MPSTGGVSHLVSCADTLGSSVLRAPDSPPIAAMMAAPLCASAALWDHHLTVTLFRPGAPGPGPPTPELIR